MLSLFKPPFWGRKLDKENRFPAKDLACGIFRNYLVSKVSRLGDENGDLQKSIDSEFEWLKKALDETPPQDHYNLIEATLRKVDGLLKDL
jgi:hypothetical protein